MQPLIVLIGLSITALGALLGGDKKASAPAPTPEPKKVLTPPEESVSVAPVDGANSMPIPAAGTLEEADAPTEFPPPPLE